MTPENNSEEFLTFLDEYFPEPTFTRREYGGNHATITEFMKSQNLIMAFIQIFISTVVFIIISSLTNYTISNKYHQIGVLKAMGYENKHITNAFIFKTFLLSIPAMYLGLLASRIGLYIFQRIMTYDNGEKRLNVITNNKITIFTMIIVTFVSLLATYSSLRKTKKISIINIIKEN